MSIYQHRVAGLYQDEALAESAWGVLVRNTFHPSSLKIVGPGDPETDRKVEPEGYRVGHVVAEDLAVGAGMGAGAGTAAAGIMAAAKASLFMAEPVLATLLAAGYGAHLGALAGGVKALEVQEPRFAAAVRDALGQGYWAVVVLAEDEAGRRKAEQVLKQTLSEHTIGY
jgi:hypothetical protein